MEGLETALDTIMAIEGMLGRDEAALLYERAREATRAIVEIGSYRGRSTVALALGSKAGHSVPVYAIDPHEPDGEGYPFGPEDRAALLRNLVEAGVADVVRVIDMPARTFVVAWAKRIDLLWIDGDHERVDADVEDWAPFVEDDGKSYLLLHDRHLARVQSAAKSYMVDDFERLPDVGGILQLHRLPYEGY